MKECANCRLRKESAKAFDIHWHGEDDCPYEKCPVPSFPPKTNADLIRSMTDEELAEQFAQEQANAIKQLLLVLDELLEGVAPPNWVAEYEEEVKKAWPEIVKEKLDWLKEEAST